MNDGLLAQFDEEARATIRADAEKRIAQRIYTEDEHPRALRAAAEDYLIRKAREENIQSYEENKKLYGVSDEQVWDFAANAIIDYWAGFMTMTVPPLLTSIRDLNIVIRTQSEGILQAINIKNRNAHKLTPISDDQEHDFRVSLKGFLEGTLIAPYEFHHTGDKSCLDIRTGSDYGPAGFVREAIEVAGINYDDYRWLFPMKAGADLSKYHGLKLGAQGDEGIFIALADLPKTIHDLTNLGSTRPSGPKPELGEPGF